MPRRSGSFRPRAARLQRPRSGSAEQVRALYITEQPDVLAVFLGAGSLEDAIDGVDSIHRAADATSGVLDEAQAARVRVASILRRQTERRGELRELRRSAVARTDELASARGDRVAYISELQAEQVLNERQIAEAVAAAEAAQASAAVQTAVAETAPSISSIGAQAIVDTPQPEPLPQPSPQPSPQAPVAPTGKTLTVVATAYILRGTTATGIPTGYGVVAVDPTVIPLGTRMTIPGYGEAVAADTGGAIKGLRIDVWVPTRQRRPSGSGRPSPSPCTEQRVEVSLGEQRHAAPLSLRELRRARLLADDEPGRLRRDRVRHLGAELLQRRRPPRRVRSARACP